MLKLIWMNYGRLDPLGRVRRQPHWCSRSRVDGQFGSDLGIFTEVENCWKERILLRKLTMDCQGVVEVIAKEVDDEKVKKTAAENSNSSRKQVGRSTARSTELLILRAVDRAGRPATCFLLLLPFSAAVSFVFSSSTS